MDNNRRTAYEVLMAVETEGAYSNIALNDAVKRRSPDDEAFVRTLVYGDKEISEQEIEDFWEIFGHLWEGQEIATIPAEQGSQDGQTMEKDL